MNNKKDIVFVLLRCFLGIVCPLILVWYGVNGIINHDIVLYTKSSNTSIHLYGLNAIIASIGIVFFSGGMHVIFYWGPIEKKPSVETKKLFSKWTILLWVGGGLIVIANAIDLYNKVIR